MSFRKHAARFIELVKADLGLPASLERVIQDMPDIRKRVDEQPPSIAMDSVVRWHEWPTRHAGLQTWADHNGIYASSEEVIDPLSQLGRSDEYPDVEFDIKDITGFSASKSELFDFRSIEDMAKKASPNFIKVMGQVGLDKNLRWPEIRIFDGHDHLVRFAWDDGLYVANSGGSHHLAAAHYIATESGLSVPGRNRLNHYSLDKRAVETLNRHYDVFAVNAKAFSELHGAMRDFNAGFSWKRLPRPHDDGMAIFLPKTDERSVKVAALLRSERFTDIGELLTALASPTAAVERRLVKDEMQQRIDALPGLENRAGVDHLFGEHAKAAMRAAVAAQIDWQAVEHAVMNEAFSQHQLEAATVYASLAKHSPGATSATARKTLRATVDAFAAFHDRNPAPQIAYDSVSPN